jgi:signal peptidase I
MQSDDINKKNAAGDGLEDLSLGGDMPNFSFGGGDELNELPPLPYNPVRDKYSDWQPMIDVSDDDDEEESFMDEEAAEDVDSAAEPAAMPEPELPAEPETVDEPDAADDSAPETIETRIEFEPMEEEPEHEPGYDRRDDLITQLAAVTGALKDRGDNNDAVVSVHRAASRDTSEQNAAAAKQASAVSDDDEETAFGDDAEPEIVDGAGLGWKRKQLRQKAQKSGVKLIVDDGEITAIAAEYIDRRSFQKSLKAAEEARAEADISDAELAALFAQAERNKARAVTEQLAANEGSVVVSADYLGKLIDRNSELDVPGEIVPDIDNDSEAAGAADRTDTGEATGETAHTDETEPDPDAPGNEESQTGSDITGDDGSTVARRKLFRPRGGEEVLDYEDVFQDDPDVTRKKSLKRRILRVVKEVLKNALIFLLVFALIIFGYLTIAVYVSRTNVVYGESMLPTLEPGDKVKTSLMPYVFGKPHTGDIVVIDMTVLDSVKAGNRFGYFARIGDVLRNNENISKMFFKGAEPDTLWIKRVVGVEGDILEFRDNKFFRNGELVVEDYLNDQTVVNYPNGTIIEVKKGYVFVMGDNRNVSNDSRNPDNGQIPVGAITGKLKG